MATATGDPGRESEGRRKRKEVACGNDRCGRRGSLQHEIRAPGVGVVTYWLCDRCAASPVLRQYAGRVAVRRVKRAGRRGW